MSKPCKLPSKEKLNSASHDLVTCGKRCWTSTKEVLQVPRATTHWTPSFVRPVKLRLSPNAAPANVVHQVVQVTQAKMAKMVNQAKMEMQADQVKMPNPTTTSSQYHPNAIATLHQAALATQDQKAQMDHQVMPDRTEVMVNQDPKDHQAHQAQLANQVTKDPKDPTANQESKKKAPQAHQAQQAKPAPQAPQDQQDHQAVQAKTVNQVAQAPQEMPVPQAVKANLVAQEAQEKMVPQVLQALALTAHQLVWLQVIKHKATTSNRLFVF